MSNSKPSLRAKLKCLVAGHAMRKIDEMPLDDGAVTDLIECQRCGFLTGEEWW